MHHFFSYPYTSEQAKEKVLELARIMTKYCGRMTVDIVGFTEIQEAIRDNCKEEYFTIIMRRFMMRISERIARDHGAKCLVTGENLGQVASQTMDAMAVTGAVLNMPLFCPLIGMDKEEIVTIARRIGTMETSILPYEDCCTVFTPKHPKTKPVLALVEAEEAKMDVEGLIARQSRTRKRWRSGIMNQNLPFEVLASAARTGQDACICGILYGRADREAADGRSRQLGGIHGRRYLVYERCEAPAARRQRGHAARIHGRSRARRRMSGRGGTREAVRADVGVSVTGLAGPDGDGTGRPIGLVYIGIDMEGFSFSQELHLTGDRAAIREQAAEAVLSLILEYA